VSELLAKLKPLCGSNTAHHHLTLDPYGTPSWKRPVSTPSQPASFGASGRVRRRRHPRCHGARPSRPLLSRRPRHPRRAHCEERTAQPGVAQSTTRTPRSAGCWVLRAGAPQVLSRCLLVCCGCGGTGGFCQPVQRRRRRPPRGGLGRRPPSQEGWVRGTPALNRSVLFRGLRNFHRGEIPSISWSISPWSCSSMRFSPWPSRSEFHAGKVKKLAVQNTS
jgi:hypothetical protein